MSTKKTLFITGVSSGFGKALANEALAAGHRVIGTVRSESARVEFEAHASKQAFGRCLDVTDFARIDAVVAEVEASLGPVHVLVNNAGYGHEGIFEESALEEMRQQFEVNVFGAVAVTKAFVPFFASAGQGTSSTSRPWAVSSRCLALPITAGANLHWRGFPTP